MIKRVVEVRPLGGVFEPLRDPARFAEAFVDLGTVCWPNELDLAPEVLYEKVSGRPGLFVTR